MKIKKEAEMKKHMEIVPDDEVAIDAIPLATKSLIIVDWKIIKEGKIGYFQIIRADGTSKRPEEGYERVLWGDLKVMFEPDVEKKRYPLTPATITEMLNKKLQADQWNEMCYQLLKLMTKQLKNPGNITTARRISTVRRIKTRERIKMKIVYQDYLRDKSILLGSTEHVHDMSLDVEENIIDEMNNVDEQPDGEAAPNTNNGPKNDWFKQPPRPSTPNPEWNKCQVLDKITKKVLVGPVYNLLKDICQSSIELEYNMEECYKALSDQLDWTNPEGDRCPFDLSKPLPLKGHPGHLTILSVVRVKVDKQFGYGCLENIVVRRADRQLYRFKEESYQKKLNITKPQKDYPTISAKEPYTSSFDPPGVVYDDLSNRKRLMRVDELYKFLDGTLKLV
ncbi:hypothetical protein Tco_0816356 [Tanacetum coccineum]